MFGKIRKIITYSTIIAIPVALIALVVKYFYNKSNGKEETVEEVVTEGMAYIKKIFDVVSKFHK